MHLLTHNPHGNLIVQTFTNEPLPPYAILSHTWHEDNSQEVSFDDLQTGRVQQKHGYGKIRFCERQAVADGLRHFWIDTCCINKSDKAEESQAIQSMFRWYRNAARCYVHLSDVSVKPKRDQDVISWETAFRKSRWFTRGWTLQELLAPSKVEFFSEEEHKLGDKETLKEQIRRATGIPSAALEGVPLSEFTVEDRFRWKGDRETTREEDGAYSLQGIFDVNLAPLYGEGAVGAFERLKRAISQLAQCISDLRGTNPRDDKKRIQDTKGGLLEDAYRWILSNETFRRWHSDLQSPLLWIKGDPGKGKTMLLCGIINELEKPAAYTVNISYFFFQATDSRINNAVAALRGLLYLLVIQQPSLISHVRKHHDQGGKTVFEDANAWIALTEIFTDILQSPDLEPTFLVVDALDECATNLPKLLDFLVKSSSAHSKAKWIISSRNRFLIEERLEQAGRKARLSLELNADSVSTAVRAFIGYKVDQLTGQKRYDDRTRQAVLAHLELNANDTFLWVALVCLDLAGTSKRHVRRKLESIPAGLDSLYERMMRQVSESDDAEVCKQILGVSSLAYRPLKLAELGALREPLDGLVEDAESLSELVSLCGSFLTLRDRTIYFVHQSAKDFLLAKAANKVFPSGTGVAHHGVFTRSLEILSRTLRRDIYKLKAFGCLVGEAQQPDPDPLAAARYSCVYWIDHLRDSNLLSSMSHEALQHGGIVDIFFRSKFLYWLEALSLCASIPKGVVSMTNLHLLIQNKHEPTSFTEFLYDAHRFFLYHKSAIETSPLQAYVSALLFSPLNSKVRRQFQHEEPDWITVKPVISSSWSACMQTLEGHSGYVKSVVFSHDSTRLASASFDNTVKIWDASSGACVQTLTVGTCIQNLSFDSTGSHLYTDIGKIAIISPPNSQPITITDPQHPDFCDIGVEPGGIWITCSGKNVLWVPSEYRRWCSLVHGNRVGIGTGSGKVWFCNLTAKADKSI
ncbi:HET-domain-containing protein [Pseudovirgaria hyperparasitica]|uniref:HET-domain-containing protein n=1 Tax=Pseudovirgaria hyperparasitica TaxID=470096 RepID=A0A6A6VQW5_9PEZI|nr:HET-domain-containing protein [Pseudovirgaria hyperparasitica]XP_033594988.1 HET-domain-containing protein [Pseudovirgaria hyperparasitica]KAF2752525.1 HET-domain-containing protein [Pseudovirgaria hyperparasitica]KAF2752530.1 HET-domain-containing protein [Pseudovirgaria hyperparasitica]